MRLNETVEALAELNSISGVKKFDTEVLPFLAMVKAELGRKGEAIADVERYQKAYTSATPGFSWQRSWPRS